MSKQMTAVYHQIPIEFNLKSHYSRQDFMVAKCNSAALRTIELWPNWPFFALHIFGPPGCGKTHLAHIFADHALLVAQKVFSIDFIQAKEIKARKVEQLYRRNFCLVVEDIDSNIDETAMFHLFNFYQNEGGYLLMTSQKPFSHINFKLPDLKSRLKMVPSIPISEPDDQMLEALIVKLFSDRQIVISADLLSYIVHNMERSFAYAQKLVAVADALSLSYKRAISVPIIKQAMYQLNHNQQQDLFI